MSWQFPIYCFHCLRRYFAKRIVREYALSAGRTLMKPNANVIRREAVNAIIIL